MAKYYGFSYQKRYLGYMNKTEFIEKVSKAANLSKNWVRERVSETGNKEDIEAMDKSPNTIIIKGGL
jgi:hypothetical protein